MGSDNPQKPVSIRDILYRRLTLYLAAGWLFATVLIGIAGAQYFTEGLRGRVVHFADMVLAFETSGESVSGQVTQRIDNFLTANANDIGVTDYFVVVIRDRAVRYSTIDLPSEALLALPLKGEVKHSVVTGGDDLLFPLTDWRLYGIEDETKRVRVIVGLWQGEAVIGIVVVTAFVFTVGLIVGAISLTLARRVVGEVVGPLERSAAAVMTRKDNEMTPIRLNTELVELAQIEDAINDLIVRLDSTVRQERDFIANAAHELRTPLAAVRAQAEAIDTQGLTPEVVNQINSTLAAADRAARLISQLLQLARSESAAVTASASDAVDLVAVARDLIAQFTPQILDTQGDIELLAPDSVVLSGNRELIYTLLRNLLENAVKYAGVPKRISLAVDTSGGSASVSVEDNGPGMSEADFHKAFAKFERLGRKSGDGAGLGLSIVQEIARRQKLEIKLDRADRLGGLKITVRFATPLSTHEVVS